MQLYLFSQEKQEWMEEYYNMVGPARNWDLAATRDPGLPLQVRVQGWTPTWGVV